VTIETEQDLQVRIRELEERLEIADETLRALRSGEVDALVSLGPDGGSVYTLSGADEAYRVMVQQMAEGALTVAPDGLILFCNEQFASLLGVPLEKVLGSFLLNFIEPEDAPTLSRILTCTSGAKAELRLNKGTTMVVPVQFSASKLMLDGLECVCLVVTDLTEHKRNQELYRTSEATSRSLFENASQGILTVDREGRIVDANAMAQRQFGYSGAEMIGEPVEMLLPESFRAHHIGHRTGYALKPYTRPKGQGMDLVARRKGGSEFPVEISLSFVAEHQGGGLAMAFISDITARKQANQERDRLIARLEGALAEKTVLLKEVHHRVKNNLAVIAGLLGMQADAVEDERLTMALEKSQQRVTSMAMVHEYLYATEHLDRVNFGKYVLELSNELCASYLISDLVIIAIEAEEIDLPVDRAIPCGLILNELLSNALKYGFPGGRSGKVTVRFARLETGELSLSCQDDGIGVLESFDWQHSGSLGLKIVQILTKQLDGELTLERSGGTRFELRFLAAGIADSNPKRVR
jgi:PAS domain S-box-containing protein